MANENNNGNIGFLGIVKVAFAVGLGTIAAMKSSEWMEKKAIPYAKKKVSEGVEYLNDIRKKKTEQALKVDDEKTE